MRFTLRALISFLLVSAFFIAIQDILLFPGALGGLIPERNSTLAHVPKGVTRHSPKTIDGEILDLWEFGGSSNAPHSGPSMLIFHGNAGDVYNFFPYQQWGHSLGYRTFGFDYRGYGRSTGWPSEDGLYKDADAVAEFLLQQGIGPKKLVIVGISIGAGPASYLAKKTSPQALVLFSPYTSIPDVAKEMPVFGVWHFLVWNVFPVRSFLSQLDATCLVISHGKRDTTISFAHSEVLASDRKTDPNFKFIVSEAAGHNDILWKTHKEVAAALKDCEV